MTIFSARYLARNAKNISRKTKEKKKHHQTFGIENMNLNVCFDYKFILKNLNRKVNRKTDKRKPKKFSTHIECGERKFKYDCV